MGTSLDRLTIKGFKSIRELVDFELRPLNVVVGGNGAGKSNFISFFRMLRALMHTELNRYVRDNGGAGHILFNGRKTTKKMEFKMRFGTHGFRFKLVPTPDDACAIEDEACYGESGMHGWREMGDNAEGKSGMVQELKRPAAGAESGKPVYDAISSWQIYHVHDTGSSSGMRHYEIIQDNRVLRMDGANIAPFMLKLNQQYPDVYTEILNSIRLVIPFFDDFVLEPLKSGEKETVNLTWRQTGSDYPMQPYHLSDGAIRFICLSTALLQPNPPSTIIIDEPELGLHPAAIVILAELIQLASQRTQVIIATQSPALIDQFCIDDLIVVNRKNNASVFERLQESDYSEWLQEYSIGELWTKNVISGGPVYA